LSYQKCFGGSSSPQSVAENAFGGLKWFSECNQCAW
jgi:hypothetical protein